MSRNWHSIIGPNGMCECGVRDSGEIVYCSSLLKREETSLREDLQTIRAQQKDDFDRAEKAEAAMRTVLFTIGGIVDGYPTARHNFIQRLRELVDIEAECLRLREWVAPREAIDEAVQRVFRKNAEAGRATESFEVAEAVADTLSKAPAAPLVSPPNQNASSSRSYIQGDTCDEIDAKTPPTTAPVRTAGNTPSESAGAADNTSAESAPPSTSSRTTPSLGGEKMSSHALVPDDEVRCSDHPEESLEHVCPKCYGIEHVERLRQQCHAMFNGGHVGDLREAFHHGIDTAFNVLAKQDNAPIVGPLSSESELAAETFRLRTESCDVCVCGHTADWHNKRLGIHSTEAEFCTGAGCECKSFHRRTR